MAAPSDVEMPERGPLSQSSSLSPPPSSTGDENEIVDSRAMSRIDSPSHRSRMDDLTTQKGSPVLESTSLSTTAKSEAMVTTRSAARMAAVTGSMDASSPPGSEGNTKTASPSSRTSTRLFSKSNSSSHPNDPADNDPVAAARPSRKRLTLKSGSFKPRTRGKKQWTAEQLLRDHRSPLAKTDIRRNEILALFPSGTPVIGNPDEDDSPRPDMAALASDDNFRHDCAVYAENLGEGKHDPEWLDEAWAAHQMRKAGEFDGYLEQKFEMEWGEAIPDELKARRNGLSPTCEQSGSQKGEGEGEMEATPGDNTEAMGRNAEVSLETNENSG